MLQACPRPHYLYSAHEMSRIVLPVLGERIKGPKECAVLNPGCLLVQIWEQAHACSTTNITGILEFGTSSFLHVQHSITWGTHSIVDGRASLKL